MKNSKTSIIYIVLLFAFFSCNKDEEIKQEPAPTTTDDEIEDTTETEFAPPSADEFSNFFNAIRGENTQKVSFNAEDGVTFISDKGTKLVIPGEILMLNGETVTGQVDLEFLEFYDRGTMLVNNITTLGQRPNGEKGILTSGGAFNIRAYQNGSELNIGSMGYPMITVPVANTGGLNPNMSAFEGTIDDDGLLIWTDLNTEFFIDSDEETYNALLFNFGWFNCDVFEIDDNNATIDFVELPSGYTPLDNSAVFITISEMPNSLSHIFTSYPSYPLDALMNAIFVSVENDQFVYAIKTLTLEANNSITFNLEDFQVADVESLTQIINDLP